MCKQRAMIISTPLKNNYCIYQKPIRNISMTEAPSLKTLLGKLVRHRLTEDEMRQCFSIMLNGEASPEQIASFISALATRGETAEDVIIGVTTLMGHATTIAAPDHAMDIVGTGGDGIGTWNISTAATFVVAGAGY
ncbi:MAG TPA: hypothetical protein DIT62_01025, partial [Alphaproteobacteria bacterium]|nr:hypothetical protein [Alphaproteobacteria bacterium]